MLVDYPSSESPDDNATSPPPPEPTNADNLKRKIIFGDYDGDAGHESKRFRRPSPTYEHHAPPAQTTISSDALPALPDSFLDVYATNVRTGTTDDPSLHDGRQRGDRHVAGGYPTHIYLEWQPSEAETTAIETFITGLNTTTPDSQVHSFLHNDLNTPLPLHISLSAPLGLEAKKRHKYLQEIREVIQTHCMTGPITVTTYAPHWHTNRLGTRHFLTLPVLGPPNNALNRLLFACNTVAARYQLPRLYFVSAPVSPDQPDAEFDFENNPPDLSEHFHISIGWSLVEQEPLENWGEGEEREDERDEASGASGALLGGMEITFHAVKVKIGNAITSIDLTVEEKVEG